MRGVADATDDRPGAAPGAGAPTAASSRATRRGGDCAGLSPVTATARSDASARTRIVGKGKAGRVGR